MYLYEIASAAMLLSVFILIYGMLQTIAKIVNRAGRFSVYKIGVSATYIVCYFAFIY